MADAKPVEATNHLVNVGLMALATLPPIQPPVAAVASRVNATDQTTWPVKINKVATTTLLSANTKFFMTTVCWTVNRPSRSKIAIASTPWPGPKYPLYKPLNTSKDLVSFGCLCLETVCLGFMTIVNDAPTKRIGTKNSKTFSGKRIKSKPPMIDPKAVEIACHFQSRNETVFWWRCGISAAMFPVARPVLFVAAAQTGEIPIETNNG